MNKAKLTEAAKAFARKDVREDDLKAFDNSWTFEMLTKGFEAGAQWYERSLEGVALSSENPRETLREKAIEVVTKWKHFWMDQISVTKDQADHDNYFHRALGVDANMKYHLAGLVADEFAPIIASQTAEIQRLRKALEFYAEPKNWRQYPGEMRSAIIVEHDCADYPHITRDVRITGGKTAREALKESQNGKN